MEKNQSTKKCEDCKGFGGKYLDTPKVCENCEGKRCYMCDRKGPYTFFEECNKCFGWGYFIIKSEDNKEK